MAGAAIACRSGRWSTLAAVHSVQRRGGDGARDRGGIFQALPLLGAGPFLLVNADVFTDFDFADLAISERLLAQLVLVPNPEHHPQGDFALVDGLVQRTAVPRWTYAGIGLYRPALFDGCSPGKFALLPLLQRAMDAGRLGGQVFTGRWSDVGTSVRLRALDQQSSHEARQ